MNTITRNAADIDAPDREALEHVIGRTLADDQRVTPAATANSAAARSTEIPSWWKIYEGLSDEEIDRLDQSIRQRANLTRVSD